MRIIPFSELNRADLHVDAVYQSGRRGNASDDPFPALLRLDSQGGFRFRGKVSGQLELLALITSMNDPDWPDALDSQTGIFTYYGDNKSPGQPLHETGRGGNEMLRRIFDQAHGERDRRLQVPPVLLFAKAGDWRDVRFLGLAVPGSAELASSEDLVAIWHITSGQRFQNYRARFTVLDAAVISRSWLDSIIAKQPDDRLAPEAWLEWREGGRFRPLLAQRSIEFRTCSEQLPTDPEGMAMIRTVREWFKGRPHAFEHCAAAIVRMMIPATATLDVTRPSRDGGRDGVGQVRIGTGPGSILVDFAMEAKLYTPPNAVGVRDMSRLISRLRHRQFGVLVTTSCVDKQAYQEIKEDRHPIVVIAAIDIVDLLRTGGRGSVAAVEGWLQSQFAPDL